MNNYSNTFKLTDKIGKLYLNVLTYLLNNLDMGKPSKKIRERYINHLDP
jgi:hypothetical protein